MPTTYSDAEVAEGLEKSIAKWEQNLLAQHPNEAAIKGNTCALCHMFVHVNLSCEGCPVFEKTGEHDCEDTPWVYANQAHQMWQDKPNSNMRRKTFHDTAQAEVDFLKSLRKPAP